MVRFREFNVCRALQCSLMFRDNGDSIEKENGKFKIPWKLRFKA